MYSVNSSYFSFVVVDVHSLFLLLFTQFYLASFHIHWHLAKLDLMLELFLGFQDVCGDVSLHTISFIKFFCQNLNSKNILPILVVLFNTFSLYQHGLLSDFISLLKSKLRFMLTAVFHVFFFFCIKLDVISNLKYYHQHFSFPSIFLYSQGIHFFNSMCMCNKYAFVPLGFLLQLT